MKNLIGRNTLLILLAACFVLGSCVSAEKKETETIPQDKNEIKAVIIDLISGLNSRDPKKVNLCFAPGAEIMIGETDPITVSLDKYLEEVPSRKGKVELIEIGRVTMLGSKEAKIKPLLGSEEHYVYINYYFVKQKGLWRINKTVYGTAWRKNKRQ